MKSNKNKTKNTRATKKKLKKKEKESTNSSKTPFSFSTVSLGAREECGGGSRETVTGRSGNNLTRN
jgi:hypothetical protein